MAHFIWRHGSGTSEAYYAADAGPLSGIQWGPAYISNRVADEVGGVVPVAQNIARDSSGDFHVIYDEGWADINYTKIDEGGTVIVDARRVGPSDSYSTRLPSLTIAPDGTVHIAHIEERYRVADIAFDKLQNDGSDTSIDRVVSSDFLMMSSSTPVVKADPYNGNIVFTMGTDQGLYLARFNTFGIQDMGTVALRSSGDRKAADVTSAPNGSMHVAWVDGGTVYYSMVNATGMRVVDGYALAGNGSALGSPRLAAASDGTVFVVWEESRAGVPQVMIAPLDPSQSLDQVQPRQITNSTVGASQPAVATTSAGDPLVAWVDVRDGQQEVYYALGVVSRCKIDYNPINLANMFFIHPNETKVFPLAALNDGILPDNFTVRIEHDAPANWMVDVAPTDFPSVMPGRAARFNLTVSAPLSAVRGDNATIIIYLESASGICADRLVVPTYVVISRELRLNGESQKSGKTGETVSFGLFIKNNGDVREENIQLLHVFGAGDDWPVKLSKSEVSLDPGRSTNFTVFITVPENAPGAVPGLFQIAAYSSIDTTVRATMQLTVITASAIDIVLTPTPTEMQILGGETANFTINVANVGNLPRAVKIDVNAQKPTGFPGWMATIDRSIAYLGGGQSTDFELQVFAAPDALAGTRLELVVTGFSANYAAEGRTTITTVVRHSCAFSLTVDPLAALVPGGAKEAALSIENEGNHNGSASFSFIGLPSDWGAAVLENGSTITDVEVPAFGARNLTWEVVAPWDTLAGLYEFGISAIGESCAAPVPIMTAAVVALGEADVEIGTIHARALPGTQATYTFQVTSSRNAGMSIVLGLADSMGQLPHLWPLFYLENAGGAGEPTPLLDRRITLEPFGTAVVSLVLSVPEDLYVRGTNFTLWLNSSTGDLQYYRLHLEIPWPDLAVASVEGPSERPVEGQTVHFAVTVENRGQRESGEGYVGFAVADGVVFQRTLGSVAPGEAVVLDIPWNPKAGLHVLSFYIVTVSGPADYNAENDVRSLKSYVQPAPRPPVDTSSLGVVAVVVMIASVAFLVVAFALYRRGRNRWWPERPPPGRVG